MDARIKQLWIDALRSGEYKQGQNRLRLRDEFCCLGVLCDLHQKENPTLGRWVYGYAYASAPNQHTNVQFEGKLLPFMVAKWSGLNDHDPYLNDKNRASSLNDAGMSFPQIADLIEKEL